MSATTDDTFTPPHGLGRKGADQEDRRDRALFASIPNIAAMPPIVGPDESVLPPPQNQGPLGACVSWSGMHVSHAVMKLDGHLKPYLGSVPALYLWCRQLDEAKYPGSTSHDWGTFCRNFWKVANKIGIPAMSKWKDRYEPRDLPTQEDEFPETSRWRVEPPPSVRKHAETRQMLTYFKLFQLEDALQCLADGFPFQTGFTVFRSFYDAQGNPVAEVPMPRPPGDRELGGHAVTVWKADIPNRMFTVRNQWGATAHHGSANFRMPFDFFLAHAEDSWSARKAEGFRPPKSLRIAT